MISDFDFNFFSSSSPVVPPTVTIYPKRPITYDNQDEFKMKCNANGFPKPTVSWERIDRDLNNVGIQSRGDELIIKNPRDTDSGYYKCLAANEVGTFNASTIVVVYSKFSLR